MTFREDVSTRHLLEVLVGAELLQDALHDSNSLQVNTQVIIVMKTKISSSKSTAGIISFLFISVCLYTDEKASLALACSYCALSGTKEDVGFIFLFRDLLCICSRGGLTLNRFVVTGITKNHLLIFKNPERWQKENFRLKIDCFIWRIFTCNAARRWKKLTLKYFQRYTEVSQ